MPADLANKEGLVNEDNLWREDDLPGQGVREQFSKCDHTMTLKWAAKCYDVLNTMYHEHHSTAEGSLHETPPKYNQYAQEFYCLLRYSINRLLMPAVSVLKEQHEKLRQLPAERKPCQTSFQTRLRVLEAKVDYLDSQIQNYLIPGQALSWSRPLVQLFLLILAILRGIREAEEYRDAYRMFLDKLETKKADPLPILPCAIFTCTGPHSKTEQQDTPGSFESHSIGTSVEKWFRELSTGGKKSSDGVDHLGNWTHETRRRLMRRLAATHPEQTSQDPLARIQKAGDRASELWGQSALSGQAIRDRQDQVNRQMVLEYPDCISNHPDERATIFNGANGKHKPRCAKCHGLVRRQFPPELIAQEESSRGVFKGGVCAEDNGELDCARLRAG